ncbi:unnamed protein product [Calicophoron daubneyi]|uniref:Calcium-activated potassium channel subunit alpha-1 n=1 Tax=Calicophoron daubneyi TaxID=300641 RepID=A0AAV2TG76_CALDB
MTEVEKCGKELIPWWIPFLISALVLLSAIGLKIMRSVVELVIRHKQYRKIAKQKSRISAARSPMDVESGSKISLRSFDQFDDSRDTEGENSENYLDFDDTENDDVQHVDNRFFVRTTKKRTSRMVHNTVAFKNATSNDIKLPQTNTETWPSSRVLKTPTMLNPVFRNCDQNLSETTSEEGVRCSRLRQLLQYYRIGLSARQQLTLKLYCERYTTVSYPAGKIMLTVYIVLCTVSWLFYLIETYDTPPISVEGICMTRKMQVLTWLNFPINLFCLGYYVLRFCAATDRVSFVLSFSSFIDVIATPPSLFAVFQRYRHVDMNFLRAASIFNYVDVLTFLGIIKSNRSIQSARICFALFTMWMVGSGIMHGVEHLGDFWDDTPHKGTWSFLETCYFLVVTISTVGYGDYVTHTTMGKIFISIFIPVSMGMTASFIPELFRNFGSNSAAGTNRYENIYGEKHVLVCGNFDNGSLRAFIKSFLCGSRSKGRVHMNMVILRPIPIDLALKAIISHYHAWVHYFVGTPNNPQDLARTKMKVARAAIVLATPNSRKRDTEDGANIMQAIALKARKKTLRVVLQLHNFRNKCLINNFPRWTYLVNDMVVCMEELKLGLMAYNCLAPGFSTLILNLLNMHGRRKSIPKNFERWREEYEYGFCMELHDVGISHEFDNLCMRDLAVFMYEKWNMILVAIRCHNTDKLSMIINPIEVNGLVKFNAMRAIVIARNYSNALQLQWYCTECNAHLLGRPCRCRKSEIDRRHKIMKERDLALYEQIGQSRRSEVINEIPEDLLVDETDDKFRRFHRHSITASSPFTRTETKQIFALLNGRSGVLDRSKTVTNFDLPADFLSDLEDQTDWKVGRNMVDRTGSFHWVHDVPLSKATLTPLRAAEFNFHRHILVCVVGKPTNGPLNLENFIMPLRFHWQEVRDIVILGNSPLIGPHEWTKLKNLPRIFIVNGDPCSFTDLYAVKLSQCSACVILGDAEEEIYSQSVDVCLQDRKTLLCAMNIRSLLQREHYLVHLTTELCYEKNAHLFNSGDTKEDDYKLPVWLNEPFARGFIFSNSLLYSCLSTFFYNDDVFHFLRVLISGHATDDLEASFAVGAGLQQALPDQKYRMPGVNVCLRSFDQPPFSFMAREKRRKPLTFREVFLRCMTCWQILCLGLYRLEDRGFRYVLANPRPETVLYAHDMFYCFMPISQKDTPEAWRFSSTLEICDSSSS